MHHLQNKQHTPENWGLEDDFPFGGVPGLVVDVKIFVSGNVISFA